MLKEGKQIVELTEDIKTILDERTYLSAEESINELNKKYGLK